MSKDNVNSTVLEEDTSIPLSEPININPIIDKLDNLIQEIQIDRNRSIEKEKLEEQELKKQQEEEQKQQKEQEKLDKKQAEEEKKISEEEQQKEQTFLDQFTTLVENSDITETIAYQEQILLKLEEISFQNSINFIFGGVFIAFACVLIYQNHMKG